MQKTGDQALSKKKICYRGAGFPTVMSDTVEDYRRNRAGQEHEEPRHNLQMVRHVEEEEEADRNQLVKMGVFKPTSGNATFIHVSIASAHTLELTAKAIQEAKTARARWASLGGQVAQKGGTIKVSQCRALFREKKGKNGGTRPEEMMKGMVE